MQYKLQNVMSGIIIQEEDVTTSGGQRKKIREGIMKKIIPVLGF